MKFFYEKFWVPIFGYILSKFVSLIEGKKQDSKNKKKQIDYFVDDLLSSDVNLLKGELDFLLMQHLFNSIDLKRINKTEIKDNDSIAA